MQSIGERMSKLLEGSGITPYQFSQRTGISQSTISRIINKNSKPNESNLKVILDYFEINEKWFVTGEGEKKRSREASPVDLNKMAIMQVPLVNKYAYAGYLTGFGDDEYVGELPKTIWQNDIEGKGEYMCFEVKGDSMDDGSYESYLEGDLLLCRNIRQDYWKSKLHINKWDFVIVHREMGILVKRIIHHDVEKGIITLHSLNDYYEDFEINLKDVAKIFNVIDSRRKRSRR